MKTDYQVGDTCYIAMGRQDGKLVKGKVVAVLNLEGYATAQFVIEIPTHIDPLLEVRDAWTMAAKKGEDLGIWQQLKEELP